MIKPYTIGMIEKYDSLESAIAGSDVVNGSIGTVTNGTFNVGANGNYFVYTEIDGDDKYTETVIAKDAHVRVANLEKWIGKQLHVSGTNTSGTIAVGDKLASNATGVLVKNTSPTGVYLVVDKKIALGGEGYLVTIAKAEPTSVQSGGGE